MRNLYIPEGRVVRRNIRHSEVEPPARHIYYKPKRINKSKKTKAMLCLLIAAHNEELVLAQTINSAIAAGMKAKDIYVVDDASTDLSSEIARSIVGPDNVIKVRHSGKGLALTKGSQHFNLVNRYRWIHIADADGAF